jgi:hypothetical protein
MLQPLYVTPNNQLLTSLLSDMLQPLYVTPNNQSLTLLLSDILQPLYVTPNNQSLTSLLSDILAAFLCNFQLSIANIVYCSMPTYTQYTSPPGLYEIPHPLIPTDVASS